MTCIENKNMKRHKWRSCQTSLLLLTKSLVRSALYPVHTCLFDKINRCFKFTVVSAIQKKTARTGLDLTIARVIDACSPGLPFEQASIVRPGNCARIIASILCWKLEYWIPWRARQFCGQSSSFVPGVVKWMKYTFCTCRVLFLPLPGNTGYSEACKHFEFGVAPEIARFRRLRALWTDSKTVFTRHTWN